MKDLTFKTEFHHNLVHMFIGGALSGFSPFNVLWTHTHTQTNLQEQTHHVNPHTARKPVMVNNCSLVKVWKSKIKDNSPENVFNIDEEYIFSADSTFFLF